MRCIVTFIDGSPCLRNVQDYRRKQWCDPCGTWSRRHDGADPNGRKPPRRKPGEVAAVLHAAAQAEGVECIILTGYRNRPNVPFNGRTMEASRVVWWIAHGDPGDAEVLHTCHRGAEGCISIRHLYLGDKVRNVQDRVDADRSCHGAAHWACKLTERDVADIRARYRPGTRWNPGNATTLARVFGVSAEQIARVARRQQRRLNGMQAAEASSA